MAEDNLDWLDDLLDVPPEKSEDVEDVPLSVEQQEQPKKDIFLFVFCLLRHWDSANYFLPEKN